MPNAHVLHIMVATDEACLELTAQLDAGEDFAACPTKHSKCPSGRRVGNLGVIKPVQLVTAVDAVVFSGEIRKVHGPVKSEFGYHLVQVLSRVG
ncbi:MAG: peptidylprolyl isomerase [Desulfuromonadaceae bacterium]|nr:peptidylprolyl isomerase [Desulfuromonadaceae bacterium]